jgi:hypothetical protein
MNPQALPTATLKACSVSNKSPSSKAVLPTTAAQIPAFFVGLAVLTTPE